MKEIKVLPRTRKDYKDLETFLRKNELLDEKGLWFAGYDDRARSDRNAVVASLFYGYSKLQVVAIKENIIYLLKNSKKGFKLYEFGKVSDSYVIRTWHNIIWPSIRIESNQDKIHIQATKNKKQVIKLKKLLK